MEGETEGLKPYESDHCQQCGTEKVLWHQALICVVCDNRDDGEGTWFADFAENTS